MLIKLSKIIRFCIVVMIATVSIGCGNLNHNAPNSKGKSKSKMKIIDNRQSRSENAEKSTNESGDLVSASARNKIRIKSVTANSACIENQGNCSYTASKMIDGDKSTAYVTRNIYGDDSLVITLRTDGEKVKKLEMRNGYQKSKKHHSDHYRPGSVSISVYNDNAFVANVYDGDLYDVNGKEVIEFPIVTDYYNKIVLSYPKLDFIEGDKYEELAISELSLYR